MNRKSGPTNAGLLRLVVKLMTLATVRSFHETLLIENTEELLALEFFNEWQETKPATLKHKECLGMKVPLFLGGDDELHNHEIIDTEFYWEFIGQLIEKVRDIPEGTEINITDIGD